MPVLLTVQHGTIFIVMQCSASVVMSHIQLTLPICLPQITIEHSTSDMPALRKKKGTIVVSTIKIHIKMYLYFSYLILNHLKYGQNPPKQLFCIWTRLAFLKKIFIKISNSYICLQITYTAFVFSPRSMTYKSVAMFNWGVCYI